MHSYDCCCLFLDYEFEAKVNTVKQLLIIRIEYFVNTNASLVVWL